MVKKNTEEQKRLDSHYSGKEDWLHWGPYLSERQWGTVREDYSAHGNAWGYFPHDHARSRVYRWGEDGLAGFTDRYCNVCFGLALWNGKDSILKERLFGLTGPEGNHGEDVKELYYYLENTPTHSYMKHLYKYPQNEYPYGDLVTKNRSRNRKDDEYEILDTGLFDKNEYFDVVTEYAKAGPDDICIKISVTNRNAKTAELHVLPTLWIRNFWSIRDMPFKPSIVKNKNSKSPSVHIKHPYTGDYNLYFEKPDHQLFTENETNDERLYLQTNDHPYKKDFFHKTVVNNDYSLAKKKQEGTKFAPHYERNVKAGETVVFKLRLTNADLKDEAFDLEFDALFEKRVQECLDFYEGVNQIKDDEAKEIQRQAFAGLLWSKQYYNYEVEQWLKGDPKVSTPPQERYHGRNSNWKTLRNHDIHLMPDAWEYPWYAAWDSAFHCITMAYIDPEFAKKQLLLFTKEWYMAPNGQIPAYEWNFSDVNPPTQAFAALQIYKIERDTAGKEDIDFLKRIFNKLSLNFNWWVNQEDRRQNNVFQGGFLGLDNIGVFDRSSGIPGNATLEQVDGTSWMALYCLNMLEISIKIALVDPSYEDMATKFFGHFIFIAEALNKLNEDYEGTWDEEEGFFYDKLVFEDGSFQPIKVRSIVGIMSLIAVLHIKRETLDRLPNFKYSVNWFRKYRMANLKYMVIQEFSDDSDLLLALVPKERVEIMLSAVFDEKEFLSEHGLRSLSKIHEKTYKIDIDGSNYEIKYEPAESESSMFGGNSNWRGPVWMPFNYLFVTAIKEFRDYYGKDLEVEYPKGSGEILSLNDIRNDLMKRLLTLFHTDENGDRPINEQHKEIYKDPHFKDLVLFYEYFHGDTGRGVGASHQTGWTALIANMIHEIY
ncbi:glycosyl hydrolase family 63 [Leeuwenhoekiella aestuarii]|uniref:Glycosyl hydrolase family 63 n=1 Tax=Leeuwenhoekiella aestuarii TaxID=2249426 RepID=A0A4Q0NSQ8_9FLAO|nr:glucosidase [Leeuwenhoekiella aestuarii]RXG14032.1 glycosyl hydrolase family 63 [Leeuwenhoekiella aestuarii]RXG18781.1 glycosyl hydrolase family 63 [Leeuwenhoekiella aestuarii]